MDNAGHSAPLESGADIEHMTFSQHMSFGTYSLETRKILTLAWVSRPCHADLWARTLHVTSGGSWTALL